MDLDNRLLDDDTTRASASTRQRARSLASQLWSEAERSDLAGEVTSKALTCLRRSNLALAPFPARFGGDDLLDPRRATELSDVLRVIAGGDLSIARLYEGHVNAVALVARYGCDAQLALMATAAAGGGLSGVWGADGAQALKAARTSAGWRLSGGKILASGAGLLSLPLVTAATPTGPLLCLLDHPPVDRIDLSGWTPLGMRSSATGTIKLSGLLIADDRVVGEPGDFLRQPHFSGGAWRFCAAHLGAAERLVDLFREHLVSRGRDGDPYQVERVATCLVAVAVARQAVEKAARLLANGRGCAEQVVAYANLTRMVTERSALTVLEAVQRGVGLSAFIRPNPIERVSRDLATYLRQPVPDLAMADTARFVLASTTPTGDLWADVDEG